MQTEDVKTLQHVGQLVMGGFLVMAALIVVANLLV